VRYAFVHQHAKQFPVTMMCRLLQVSRSGCYAAHERPPSLRNREDIALRARIEQLHEEHWRAPGVIKTWRLLTAEGVNCGRNRVAKLRRIAGIETRRTARFKKMRTYQKTEPPAPDLVKRHFAVKTLNRVWVGDMTYIPTRKGPLHLAAFIDLCTHRVIGWAIATSQTAKLAVTALQAGIERQRPAGGLVCHTDQGSQFASVMFRNHLRDHQIRPSMSRKGNCHDNAVAESFFSNLKNELTHHTSFDDQESAVKAITEYIDVYYNQRRLHQSLGYRTPAQVEALHRCP
jgi:transposase InsO family protein